MRRASWAPQLQAMTITAGSRSEISASQLAAAPVLEVKGIEVGQDAWHAGPRLSICSFLENAHNLINPRRRSRGRRDGAGRRQTRNDVADRADASDPP